MDASRWQRAKNIFFDALDRAPAERRAFLESACAGDAELHAEVSSLLEAHREDDTFIEQPAALDALGIAADGERPGWIGRSLCCYRVVGELGRGGMSEVYRGVRDDDEFHKEVAVKVLRSGYDTESLLRRFSVEKQILARLDHPNIARLLDAGSTPDKLPYLVMDYINGRPIDEYCRVHQLSVPQRLELFLSLCDAVQYVHRHLMVHGDLKCNNILVTDEGVVKLLDFGIARLLAPEAGQGDGRMTAFVALTPECASPEQIRGQAITTASDVYSLGVLLYRLLTGASPYRITGELSFELSREICEQEPLRPSVTARLSKQDEYAGTWRQLIGDLDNIVMLALRKEPTQRYASVEQLAGDVRRHLEGFPVLARGTSVGYRLSKFVSRHRISAAAAALFVLSLVGGIVATSWQAHVAGLERARAERHFENVRRLADSYMFDVHAAIENLPGSTPARQMLVENSLKYLDALAREAADDASLQRDLATAYEKVADVQGGFRAANLGDTAGAIASYRKALDIRTALIEADPANHEVRRELLRNTGKLSDMAFNAGDADAAIEYSRRTVSLAEALAAAEGATAADRRNVANAYLNLGWQLAKAQQAARGLALMNNAAAIYESLVDATPDDTFSRRNLALAYSRMGEIQLESTTRYADALRMYQSASVVTGALLEGDPQNANLRKIHAHTFLGAASAHLKMGAPREALAEQQTAVRMLRELLDADPKNEDARTDAAFALGETSETLIALGELQSAEAHVSEAIDVLNASASATQAVPGTVQFMLGLDYFRLGRTHALRAADSRASAVRKRQFCQTARSWFERSAPIISAAETDELWRPTFAGKSAEISSALAPCANVLASAG